MIGKLKGLIDSYGEDYVLLDVGGVGYQVHCSARTLQHLPSPGEAAVLSIETYVREDQIKLFGFRSDQEREWFRLLQTVQGVGAKVALAVLARERLVVEDQALARQRQLLGLGEQPGDARIRGGAVAAAERQRTGPCGERREPAATRLERRHAALAVRIVRVHRVPFSTSIA